jgi:hypothetical protein
MDILNRIEDFCPPDEPLVVDDLMELEDVLRTAGDAIRGLRAENARLKAGHGPSGSILDRTIFFAMDTAPRDGRCVLLAYQAAKGPLVREAFFYRGKWKTLSCWIEDDSADLIGWAEMPNAPDAGNVVFQISFP